MWCFLSSGFNYTHGNLETRAVTIKYLLCTSCPQFNIPAVPKPCAQCSHMVQST